MGIKMKCIRCGYNILKREKKIKVGKSYRHDTCSGAIERAALRGYYAGLRRIK